MFINDFDLKIHLYGDEGKFALVTIDDGREKAFNKLPSVSIPIENVTPESIGEKIAEYIKNNCTEEDGWTVVFYPWDDDEGKPRVAGRFKTDEEKDKFLEEIHKQDSGWLNEELSSISVINDYWYMLPA